MTKLATLAMSASLLLSTSARAATVFLDDTLGPAAQQAQESAFLTAVPVTSLIDFDDQPAGNVVGDEWLSQGAGFAKGDGVPDLTLLQADCCETPHSAPNALWIVEPGQIIDINLVVPTFAFGFWLMDSEFLAPNDSIDYFDVNDELIESLTMPISGFRTGSIDANFFIGFVLRLGGSFSPWIVIGLGLGGGVPASVCQRWTN